MKEPPSDILTLSDLRPIGRKLKVKKTVIISRPIGLLKNTIIQRLKNKGNR